MMHASVGVFNALFYGRDKHVKRGGQFVAYAFLGWQKLPSWSDFELKVDFPSERRCMDALPHVPYTSC